MDCYYYYYNNTYTASPFTAFLLIAYLLKLQAGAHQAFCISEVGELEPALAGVGKPFVRPKVLSVLSC
jgi:hypothetical protein